MGNTNNEDTVWCFDANTGEPVWHHSYAAQLNPQWYQGGPGSTPTVDGNRVVTISKWGDVFCFDAAKGTVLWQRDLRRDGVKTNRWGFAGLAADVGQGGDSERRFGRHRAGPRHRPHPLVQRHQRGRLRQPDPF